MKLAKTLGRIGFGLGFVGPILFYSVPDSPSLACPFCLYVSGVEDSMSLLRVWVKLGIVQGLILALIGFVMGYSISRIRKPA